MKRVCALFALAASLAVPLSFAQEAGKSNPASMAVPKDDQATKEDVMALIEATHGRQNAEAAMQMMVDNMKKGARASFLQDYPNASPAVLKKLDGTFEGTLKFMNVDDLLAAMVPVYQKYLSHEDAISIISFYSSPSGQRYMERMPAMFKDVGDLTSQIVKDHIDEINQQSKKSMEEFWAYVKAHPEEVGAPTKSE